METTHSNSTDLYDESYISENNSASIDSTQSLYSISNLSEQISDDQENEKHGTNRIENVISPVIKDSKLEIETNDTLSEDEVRFNKQIQKKQVRPIIDSDTEDSDENFGAHKNESTPIKNEIWPNNSIITPRNVRSIIESDTTDDEVVDISSDEENILPLTISARKHQQISSNMLSQIKPVAKDLNQLLSENSSVKSVLQNGKQMEKSQSTKEVITVNESVEENLFETPITVSVKQYEEEKKKLESLRVDFQKSANLLKTVNISALPDNGAMLYTRHNNLESSVKNTEHRLLNMKVSGEMSPPQSQPLSMKPTSWVELQTSSTYVQPKTFGKQAMATFNAQRALTMDRLEQLHGSIKTCPTEETVLSDPAGLRVELMPHQQHALAWLMWREKQKPSGGILADDMGLGKTLTIISLLLKSREERNDKGDEDSDEENNPHRRSYKYNGGTLIICPASLLNQWENEVKKHCRRGLISVELYHGPKREVKAKHLAKHDMVITTYAICKNEYEKSSALNGVRWRRIVLDEAHQIRNHKCLTSKAVCEVFGKSRWALSGTPVHNKELDIYALLKFLRCTPFDDLAVWKRWVSDKSAGGQQRLQSVLSSLMLRRTKEQLQEKGGLKVLPNRNWELIEVKLDKTEMDVYQKILIFSRTLFAQFLHQRAEKNTDYLESQKPPTFTALSTNENNSEYMKMHKMLIKLNKIKVVKQHEILVLLLRLRQVCCHPCLIKRMLHGEEYEDLGDEEEGTEELNILEQLNKLNLDDAPDNSGTIVHDASMERENGEGLARASRALLNPSNLVFQEDYRSSKVQAIITLLKKRILPTSDKTIIVSQFTSLLAIIAVHLKNQGVPFEQLDGSVKVNKRMDVVNNLNDPQHPAKVLLLSLTAGGVGLNLVGANHLFLTDLHWNPQLELQAQDRIYRVGQTKPVNIYKFIAVDTIEVRIKQLQEFKLNLANSMLTGAKMQYSKLSLEDMKMLFNM